MLDESTTNQLLYLISEIHECFEKHKSEISGSIPRYF